MYLYCGPHSSIGPGFSKQSIVQLFYIGFKFSPTCGKCALSMTSLIGTALPRQKLASQKLHCRIDVKNIDPAEGGQSSMCFDLMEECCDEHCTIGCSG